MANKTKPTTNSVVDFLDTIDEKKKKDAEALMDMMASITHLEPVMWGPSIIGFGSESYTTASGHPEKMPRLAFSPRKSALTVYFDRGFTHVFSQELQNLGKHRTSVSCLYINRLSDINQDVLKEMLKSVWEESQMCQSCALPFDEKHKQYIAKERDGSDSIYCTYCYKDGEFLEPQATIQDMIEMGVPHLACKIGEKAAREELTALVPTLKRWRR